MAERSAAGGTFGDLDRLDEESDIRTMTLDSIHKQAQTKLPELARRLHGHLARKPLSTAIVLLFGGLCAGGALNAAGAARLQAQLAQQETTLDSTRREAQREVNALAARLGELQAQANRL
ncbi:MAG: hypothetical protein KA124_13770, partial [Luteimonas sp.]|nr:hypothetical protein [Luteimonas sp.]